MELFTIVFLVGAVGPIGYISSIFADHPPPRFSKLLPRVLQMASASSMAAVLLLVLVLAESLLLLPLLYPNVLLRRSGGVSRVFSRSWCVH